MYLCGKNLKSIEAIYKCVFSAYVACCYVIKGSKYLLVQCHLRRV